MYALAKLLLMPGELVLKFAEIKETDHQVTIRMLVNSLFWGFVCIGLAFVFSA